MGRGTRTLVVVTALNVAVLAVNAVLTLTLSRSGGPVQAGPPRRTERMSALDRDDVEGSPAFAPAVGRDEPPEDSPEPTERRVTLNKEQLSQLREDVYREERRWRRRASVLHGLARLEQKGVLPSLARPVRGRILDMATGFAERRTALERAAMASSDMDQLERGRGDLHAFDESEASRMREELRSILNAAEAKQVVRVIVPGLG